MNNNEKKKRENPEINEGAKIHWHPGFYGGMEIELIEYKSMLSFEIEHELSKEPIKIDMLIIKKNVDVKINNQIGFIFRKYNILEYKSPTDGMTIDDYIKAVGYTFIYKGLGDVVNKIPFQELTVTMCRDIYPRELMNAIENAGGTVKRAFPGIYYITGLIAIPSQIIVTSELEGMKHAVLRILSNNAKEEDVRQFIAYSSKFDTPGDINNASAVFQVSTNANKALYNKIGGDGQMCQALMELLKDQIDEKVNTAVDVAVDETSERDIKSLMDTLHLSADEAMDILKIPAEKRKIYVVNL